MIVYWDAFSLSVPGKARSMNDDYACYDTQTGIYLVADGVGGQPAGGTASRIAAEAFCSAIRDEAEGGRLRSEVLVEAVCKANLAVRRAAADDARLTGMSTTLTALVLSDTGAKVVHVGDSRLYRLSGGALACLTRDHTIACEMEQLGMQPPRLTRGWLSRALGYADTVQADVEEVGVGLSDVFLLATDGLAKCLSQERLAQIMRETMECSALDACTLILMEARKARQDDDLSLCVVKPDEYLNHVHVWDDE